MRIIAIAANDSLGVHQALLEGMIVEDFVLHLAVVLEEVGRQQRWRARVHQRFAGTPM